MSRQKVPVGAVTTRKDGSRWRKVAEGEWEPVREGGDTSGAAEVETEAA